MLVVARHVPRVFQWSWWVPRLSVLVWVITQRARCARDGLVVDALVRSTIFVVGVRRLSPFVDLPNPDFITRCLHVAHGHSLALSARTRVVRRPYWLRGVRLVSWWFRLHLWDFGEYECVASW
jgi:hypothetical protein